MSIRWLRARFITTRWLVAVSLALSVFFGCWGGLAAWHVLDTAAQLGISAAALFTVLMATFGAWVRAIPRRQIHMLVHRPGAALKLEIADEAELDLTGDELQRLLRGVLGSAATIAATAPDGRDDTGRSASRPDESRPDTPASQDMAANQDTPADESPDLARSILEVARQMTLGLDDRVPGDEPGEPGPGSRRYLTGLLPERAPTGARVSLLVQITQAARPQASALMDAFSVGPSGVTVTIIVSAVGLIPMGDLEQDLTVLPGADSRPVRFPFITGMEGLHVVNVRAFIKGTCVGELALEVSVEAGAALEEGRPRADTLDALAAEPGEVTLQVSRTAQGGYSFQRLSESLYPMVLVDRLAGDPAAVVGQMIAELRAMSKGQSPYATPALVRRRLRSLGTALWADVVPDAIRDQFWAQHDRIRHFTIASDIDTVPWELLHPVDGDNENGFLAEQFPVVRRVYGQSRARVLGREDYLAAFVVPPKSPASAMSEVGAVWNALDQAKRWRLLCMVTGLAEVLELLDSVPSVLHFAGHSAFDDETGSLISLNGGPLRPGDISYARQKRAFEYVRPLVFLNGCRTAGEVPGFTQMNGWAKAFMGAGAAAFIGSLWAVRSRSAQLFAEAFDSSLVRQGQPLGAASLDARKAIAEDDGDPTWLAYTIYGNPSASFARPGPTRQALPRGGSR